MKEKHKCRKKDIIGLIHEHDQKYTKKAVPSISVVLGIDKLLNFWKEIVKGCIGDNCSPKFSEYHECKKFDTLQSVFWDPFELIVGMINKKIWTPLKEGTFYIDVCAKNEELSRNIQNKKKSYQLACKGKQNELFDVQKV